MELSKRLQAVADLISMGMTVADVGTDHGYIPIYLLESKKSPKALAMDVNAGPLLRAKEHIAEHGLESFIETRQSDGVRNLQVGECDCVVIAGMGGALTTKILEEGQEVFRTLKEFVLQPQSELHKVRQYLREHDYSVIAEDMVFEDGKFYPMMKAVNCPDSEYSEEELYYGRLLLKDQHPILKTFLEKELGVKEAILESLHQESGAHIELRKRQIESEMERIKYALQRYYEVD